MENLALIETDLIVEPNLLLTLPARLNQYRNIHVKPGAILAVQENSSQWCIIWASGEVLLEGSILVKRHRAGARSVQTTTPDGKSVTFQYNNQALGGTGGRGGASRGGSTIMQGGNGALGTVEYGGGGGSCGGAIIQGPSSRGGSAGNNATDWRGAPPATVGGPPDSSGGAGARLDAYGNGGLLLIYCNSFAGNGAIVASGDGGRSGAAGASGSDASSPRGGYGGSGGGGGAPGGQGGRIIIVAAEATDSVRYLVDGGRGGGGGAVGRYPNGAQPGTAGDSGEAGVVDFYTKQQWAASNNF